MFRRILKAFKKALKCSNDSDIIIEGNQGKRGASKQFRDKPGPDDAKLHGTEPGDTEPELDAYTGSKNTESENPEACIIKSAFERVPENVWVEIATLLSVVDRASLAFTCRYTHTFMSKALKLAPTNKYEFILRLEKDGVWLAEILCGKCRKFHLPRGEKQPKGCSTRPFKSRSLPSQVEFDLVTAILRCHKFNSTLYTVDHLASTKEYADQEAKIINYVSAQISQGNLILKSETILCAGNDRLNALKYVPKLKSLLRKHHELGQICHHNDWVGVMPFASGPRSSAAHAPRFHGQLRSLVESNLHNQATYECLWTHPRTCWTECNASSALEARLEGLWYCTCCSTDFKITIVHGEGRNSRAKFVVLTSWKNLGYGSNLGEYEWREYKASPDVSQPHRRFQAESAAKRFEDRGAGGDTWVSYRPSRWRLEEFFP
ncbi:hypothetical protein B0T10DRAFT_563302 [Thelonectria olida]|uniref:F-box domain-containing protein n=1 Tax=Thelonectria olida TaxID=1576542 RepID=A0A9P8W268_9HYPO|nr:hypothetical protein B0T10DRAFT_563302 [Thelonectria olida]